MHSSNLDPKEETLEGDLKYFVHVVHGAYYRFLEKNHPILQNMTHTSPDQGDENNKKCMDSITECPKENAAERSGDTVKNGLVEIPRGLESFREKKPPGGYTHFISLPLSSEALQGRVKEFTAMVLSNQECQGVDKKMFLPPGKLHLTVCMISLPNVEKIQHCCTLLNTLKENFQNLMQKEPLVLNFQGITTWEHKKFRNQTVIFTKPSGPTESLHQLDALARVIIDRLLSERMIEEDQFSHQDSVRVNHVKENKTSKNGPFWHATLFNTKYSRQRINQCQLNVLLNTYKDFDFGSTQCCELHLSCLKFTTTSHPVANYYRAESIINLL